MQCTGMKRICVYTNEVHGNKKEIRSTAAQPLEAARAELTAVFEIR